MIHKVSELCDKIDGIKRMSDHLRKLKYESPKASKLEIDSLIETIQSDCFMVSQDTGEYNKK
jgi:hypothetical protein